MGEGASYLLRVHCVFTPVHGKVGVCFLPPVCWLVQLLISAFDMCVLGAVQGAGHEAHLLTCRMLCDVCCAPPPSVQFHLSSWCTMLPSALVLDPLPDTICAVWCDGVRTLPPCVDRSVI